MSGIWYVNDLEDIVRCRDRLWRNTTSENTNTPMKFDDLGIVVIGRNEGQRLIDCLTSLKVYAAEVPIVYVDSGSTDGSLAAAQERGAVGIKLSAAVPFTAARARNEGFRKLVSMHMRTRFVQFIDGDCELVPSWLETAMAFAVANIDVAVVCGRRRERHPDHSIYNRICDIEWNSPIGNTSTCGGDALVRVDAFKAIGGFNSKLIAGEEPEMCMRLRGSGWQIWRLDAEMTRHDAAMSRFGQWWARAVRSGYAEAEILSSYPLSMVTPSQKKEFSRSIVWAGILPAVLVLASLFYWPVLFGFLAYGMQIVRISSRRGMQSRDSWLYATLMMCAKFAQVEGALKYYASWFRNQSVALIDYKSR